MSNLQKEKDLLDVAQLRLLKMLCHTGQLSAAAEALMISVSAASRQLAAARRKLRDDLFLRNGNGLVPTARMKALEQRISALLTSLEALSGSEVFSPATATGCFRLLAYDNAFLVYVIPVLPQLMREAPGITFTFGFVASQEQLLTELRDGSADLAIYPVPPMRADTRTASLPPQTFRFLMRREHPLVASGEPEITLDRLRQYGQIMPGNRPERPWTILAAQGVPTTIVPFFNTAPFLLLESDLIMWCPEAAARRWQDSGLFAVRDVPAAFSYTLMPLLTWNSRTDADPLHQWVRSRILSGCRVRPETEGHRDRAALRQSPHAPHPEKS